MSRKQLNITRFVASRLLVLTPLYNVVEGGELMIVLQRLVELRKKHGLTQEQVAGVLEIGRSTYANYEQGLREMDYDLLIRLSDFYKVSLDYLFGRTDLPIHFESYTEDEVEFILRTIHIYKEIKAKIT